MLFVLCFKKHKIAEKIEDWGRRCWKASLLSSPTLHKTLHSPWEYWMEKDLWHWLGGRRTFFKGLNKVCKTVFLMSPDPACWLMKHQQRAECVWP